MKIADLFKGATKEQAKDFGMVLALACIIAFLYTGGRRALYCAVAVLLIDVIYPAIYRVFASAWFNLSRILGNLVSKLILSLVFVIMVIPLGVLRRFLGFDSLNLKKWKKDSTSVFRVRDHAYGPEDLDRPY